MGENSLISWCDHTFNPWIGCEAVSPGCERCYAEQLVTNRMGRDFASRHRTSAANWGEPVKWNRQAAAAGTRPRVFCASLADVFDNKVPAAWHSDLFALIEATPNLNWLLLTKRIGNAARILPARWTVKAGYGFPRNLWLGATVVNQEEADRDIPKLLAYRDFCRVLWLSLEPQLDAITIGHLPYLDWIITGGESAASRDGARPFAIEWAEDVMAQCSAAGVPVHVKQLGSNPTRDGRPHPQRHRKGGDPAEWPPQLRVQEFPQ